LTLPALAGDVGEVRLSVDDSVDDERRITTEDESVDCRTVRFGNRLCLCAREQFDHLCWVRSGPAAATTASSSTPGEMVVGSLRHEVSQGEPVTLRREREAQPDTTLTVGWTMGDAIGTDIELTLTGIAHGGFAVGRLDGRVD